MLTFEDVAVSDVPAMRTHNDNSCLLKPQIMTSAAAKYFKFIGQSPCQDAISNFKERFQNQMIEKGKMGRASDEIPTAVAEAILQGTKSMPMPWSGVAMSGQAGFSKMVNDAMRPQLWGCTSSWEVSAAEPGYLGSLRLNIEGTRTVAITKMLDAMKFLKSQRGENQSSGLYLKSVTLDVLFKWFRNLEKD